MAVDEKQSALWVRVSRTTKLKPQKRTRWDLNRTAFVYLFPTVVMRMTDSALHLVENIATITPISQGSCAQGRNVARMSKRSIKMPSRLMPIALAMLAAVLSAAAPAAVIIDTNPTNSEVASAGDMGQTFRAPLDATVLSSIKFMGFAASPTNVKFQLAIFAYDDLARKVSGGSLYLSPQTTALTMQLGGRSQNFTFSPNIELVPGAPYLTVLREHDLGNDGNLQMKVNTPLLSGFHDYADGVNVLAPASRFYPYTTVVWNPSSSNPDGDLGFTATFVPEPSTVAISLLCVVTPLLARRARRTATVP